MVHGAPGGEAAGASRQLPVHFGCNAGGIAETAAGITAGRIIPAVPQPVLRYFGLALEIEPAVHLVAGDLAQYADNGKQLILFLT